MSKCKALNARKSGFSVQQDGQLGQKHSNSSTITTNQSKNGWLSARIAKIIRVHIRVLEPAFAEKNEIIQFYELKLSMMVLLIFKEKSFGFSTLKLGIEGDFLTSLSWILTGL